MKKRIICIIVNFCITSILSLGTVNVSALSNDIVILYTNDVHTYINNTVKDDETETVKTGLSYDSVAALKEDIKKNETPNVLLVDAGDHIQGTAYGSMDEGQSIIKLMNLAKYDVATLGNHEFDYRMDGMFESVKTADFPYVSCNFMDLKTNKTVLDAYKIFSFGDKKIAFVGITTPDVYTATSPKYFEDSNGNIQYGFMNGSDGSLLYNTVQNSINNAKAEGADYVIGLAHLGNDYSSSPYTSYEVIKNTTGLAAVIDGHSHSTIESEKVIDKNGKTVVVTQTGNYFANVGKMVISSEGNISTTLINQYDNFNSQVRAEIDKHISAVDSQLGEKIANTLIDLKISDEQGNRIVRITEASMGDFVADSYYYYINEVEGINCDIAVTNGGGVRADLSKGDLTYMDMKNVSPFGNVLCIVKVTGQQILDLLEWGSRSTDGTVNSVEIGAFMQVAGVSFGIDTSVESTVPIKDGNLWGGSPTGEYRVKDLKIFNKALNCYEPIDLDREYTLAGINYTLRNKGDGCGALFDGAKLVKDYILEDYLVTSAYVKAFADTNGDGIADINSDNSPLKKYSGYLLNYDTHYGSNRISINDYSIADVKKDNTDENVNKDDAVTSLPKTNDNGQIFVFLIFMVIGSVGVLCSKKSRIDNRS